MRNVILRRLGKTFAAACLAFCLAPSAKAQNAVIKPDCVIDVVFTAAGQTAGGPGTCGQNTNAVYEWRFAYKSTGFSALSVIVQSAPDVAGSPGAWVTFAGTVTGSNPNTAITQASTNFVGFNPWVRVLLTSKTGTGTLTGQLYGCREPGCSIAGASITAMVTIPTPLPVDGPTAAGAPPTTPPVLVAGQDGSPGNIRTLKTDALGQQIPSNTASAGTDGVSNTQQTPTGAGGAPLFVKIIPYILNGATNDRQFGCTGQAPFTISGATDVVVVPGVAATITRICHISLSWGTTAADMTFQQGTGTTCLTSTAALTGAYAGLTWAALDFGNESTLRTTIAGRDACLHFSTAVTGGGVAIYAAF